MLLIEDMRGGGWMERESGAGEYYLSIIRIHIILWTELIPLPF